MLKCPFCAEAAHRALFFSFNFFYCAGCRSIFREDVCEKGIYFYEKTYYGQGEKKFSLPLFRFLKKSIHHKRWNYIKSCIQSGDRVLDVGCGHGDWLEYLLKKTHVDAVGVELPGYPQELLKNKTWLTLITTPFVEMKCDEKKFKGIFFLHSFEHMHRPVEVLNKAIQMLAEDGFIYIAIPNVNSWQYRIFRKCWLHLDPLYHVHLPSINWLKNFFEQQGFVTQVEKHNHFLYSLVGWIFSPLNLLFPGNKAWENLKKEKKNKWIYLTTFVFIALFSLPAIMFYVAELLFRKGATVELMIAKK